MGKAGKNVSGLELEDDKLGKELWGNTRDLEGPSTAETVPGGAF